ncbi:hypothetical protein B0H10DRAFT_213030 [Mycena sp. CBHHK59/15]|nr:hypothetical protein B0H10DRAFT_213030 [Mycena sp. CBHHK59/15]
MATPHRWRPRYPAHPDPDLDVCTLQVCSHVQPNGRPSLPTLLFCGKVCMRWSLHSAFTLVPARSLRPNGLQRSASVLPLYLSCLRPPSPAGVAQAAPATEHHGYPRSRRRCAPPSRRSRVGLREASAPIGWDHQRAYRVRSPTRLSDGTTDAASRIDMHTHPTRTTARSAYRARVTPSGGRSCACIGRISGRDACREWISHCGTTAPDVHDGEAFVLKSIRDGRDGR